MKKTIFALTLASTLFLGAGGAFAGNTLYDSFGIDDYLAGGDRTAATAAVPAPVDTRNTFFAGMGLAAYLSGGGAVPGRSEVAPAPAPAIRNTWYAAVDLNRDLDPGERDGATGSGFLGKIPAAGARGAI